MAETFNKFKPPKEIDFLRLSYVQLTDRDDDVFFHMEAYVEGSFTKIYTARPRRLLPILIKFCSRTKKKLVS